MARLAELLRDERFVLGRLAAAGRDDAELLAFASVPGGVRITTRSRIPMSEVPAWLAPRFTDGGPISERTENWRFGETLHADVVIESPSGGSRFAGATAVTGTPNGCALRTTGAFTMRMPIIGKRVEAFSASSFAAALDAETAFIAAGHWAAGGSKENAQ